jgi:ribulose kinase
VAVARGETSARGAAAYAAVAAGAFPTVEAAVSALGGT